MSALWFKIYDGMINRGSASLAGIDGCKAKGLLTEDEHAELTAKWRSLNEPTPNPEPTPAPEPEPATEEPQEPA